MNWRTIIPKKFFHCCEGSRPHIRLSNLGIWQRHWNPQGIWLWRTAGFDYRTSTGLGETATLGGHKQNLMGTRTQGKEAVSPKETEPDLPVSVWKLIGVQYATVEEWRNSSRKNEEAGPGMKWLGHFPKKKKCKKANWLSEEALQIAEKTREVKGKGERER